MTGRGHWERWEWGSGERGDWKRGHEEKLGETSLGNWGLVQRRGWMRGTGTGGLGTVDRESYFGREGTDWDK
jgi:hypothetical protein